VCGNLPLNTRRRGYHGHDHESRHEYNVIPVTIAAATATAVVVVIDPHGFIVCVKSDPQNLMMIITGPVLRVHIYWTQLRHDELEEACNVRIRLFP
jgi:hypothetical protein